MPATTNDSISAGPVVSCAATPVRTKMPVPMIAPTPRLVSWTGPEHAAQPVLALQLLEQHRERFLQSQLIHGGPP